MIIHCENEDEYERSHIYDINSARPRHIIKQ